MSHEIWLEELSLGTALVPSNSSLALPSPSADNWPLSNDNGYLLVNFFNSGTDIDPTVFNTSKERETLGASGGRFQFMDVMNASGSLCEDDFNITKTTRLRVWGS
ncbi:hypothetical protein K435DRAFT_797296 [Dendrothele bispora CBS 962.96]|uniref:Uncharacterized protein n=1 Tax=Dendrothele bispora (strain CBS 962.96) TaxID=1314807 RepID=A0A4S8M3J6_DENBC|nr:hypothetical protein K435DRAFT_797296 [Dendrothele bispora CBS 962.96]